MFATSVVMFVICLSVRGAESASANPPPATTAPATRAPSTAACRDERFTALSSGGRAPSVGQLGGWLSVHPKLRGASTIGQEPGARIGARIRTTADIPDALCRHLLIT